MNFGILFGTRILTIVRVFQRHAIVTDHFHLVNVKLHQPASDTGFIIIRELVKSLPH